MFNRLLNVVGLIIIQLLFAFGFQGKIQIQKIKHRFFNTEPFSAEVENLPQLNAHRRKVRDDASYLSDSGGPVASSGRDGDADTAPESNAKEARR